MKLTFENYIAGDISPNLVVIYPGRFQPAHKNHTKVYNFLVENFPYADIFVATSNKIDLPRSPFSFFEKKKMLVAAGIPEANIIQTANPYVAAEITKKYDASAFKVIFAVGGKDMDPAAPRFNFLPTKKGDAYFKPLAKLEDITPETVDELYTLNKHGYVATTPTFNFSLNIVGTKIPVKGATQIRELYKSASDLGKKEIITQLYGHYDEEIYDIFNKRLV